MSLLRFLGLGGDASAERGDSGSVRRIADRLERLDPDKARYLAAFAYVLARVAHADLEIDASETSEMERVVGTLAELSADEASLVVEIAKSQARLLGGTENYLVTREFRELADKQERARLLRCAFAVAAADGSISNLEGAEISRIAEELGFTPAETNALRAEFRDKLSVFQAGGPTDG